MFVLISQELIEQNSIRSVYATQVGNNVVMLISTKILNPNGTYTLSETTTTIHHAYIKEYTDTNEITGETRILYRKILPKKSK